jgi:hypothetical protein
MERILYSAENSDKEDENKSDLSANEDARILEEAKAEI